MTKHANPSWAGEAGRAYTDRNPETVAELNELRLDTFGRTQHELNEEFVGDLDRNLRILEVGTNRGLQLEVLHEMGFERLYGVDVNEYALRLGREQFPTLNLVAGDARHLPFRDGYFDLVFTNGTLITIPPVDIDRVVDELARSTRRYVLGAEFYADEYVEIENRPYWKTDFARKFTENHEFRVVRERPLHYRSEDNEDRMYLLERTG